MKSFFVLASLVASALAQSVSIGAPPNLSTVYRGSNFTVEVDKPVCSLTVSHLFWYLTLFVGFLDRIWGFGYSYRTRVLQWIPERMRLCRRYGSFGWRPLCWSLQSPAARSRQTALPELLLVYSWIVHCWWSLARCCTLRAHRGQWFLYRHWRIRWRVSLWYDSGLVRTHVGCPQHHTQRPIKLRRAIFLCCTIFSVHFLTYLGHLFFGT